ncbi:MAG: hypothetical protein Q9M36_04035 [Sulfurovum sp.]|nr:hypothetical protein [Sulfurovum sp.]
MSKKDEFLTTLKAALSVFAQDQWKQFATEALRDTEVFIIESKDDLIRWHQALQSKQLSKKDFEWLIASKKDEVSLLALKELGLAKVAQDRFINGMLDLVVNTAFKTLL